MSAKNSLAPKTGKTKNSLSNTENLEIDDISAIGSIEAVVERQGGAGTKE